MPTASRGSWGARPRHTSETIDPDAEVVTLTGPDGASWTVTPQRAIERRDGKETVYPLDIPKPGFKPNAFADCDPFL